MGGNLIMEIKTMDIQEKLDKAQKTLGELADRFNAIGREITAMEEARQELLTEMRRLEGEIRAYKGLIATDTAKPPEQAPSEPEG